MTPPTSVQNSAIFAPFTKGKSHRPLFALFSKNATFFRPKKGPRTGLSHSLTHLTAIQFSDHAKSMAQITERIFNEAPSRCRSQKSIIFRRRTKKEWTSVFLHYRMDRALRAKTLQKSLSLENQKYECFTACWLQARLPSVRTLLGIPREESQRYVWRLLDDNWRDQY